MDTCRRISCFLAGALGAAIVYNIIYGHDSIVATICGGVTAIIVTEILYRKKLL